MRDVTRVRGILTGGGEGIIAEARNKPQSRGYLRLLGLELMLTDFLMS